VINQSRLTHSPAH